tara:strand:- start:1389 stop:2033 length:645 start_codon:yes stop_codon:yes gene_type:complete
MKKIKVKPENLKVGDTLLMSFRRIDRDKIMVEIGERINTRSTDDRAISLFNESDELYEPGIRRAWYPADPKDILKHFGLDVDKLKWTLNAKGQDVCNLNYLNPKALGKRLRVIIEESIYPNNEYQVDNAYNIAKRRGKDGDYCTHDGKLIFANTDVILTNKEKIDHTILPIDKVKYEAITKTSTDESFYISDLEAFVEKCAANGVSVDVSQIKS